jgi:hypothetical protein
MQLKKWPTDDQSYIQALWQTTKFICLFLDTENPNKFEDYTEALEIYKKLVKEICEKYKLQSTEHFWRWCYFAMASQVEILEEKLSQ